MKLINASSGEIWMLTSAVSVLEYLLFVFPGSMRWSYSVRKIFGRSWGCGFEVPVNRDRVVLVNVEIEGENR